MVLTFTGSLSVAEAGRDDVRAMLVGALGCNFAWGVIDGLFYLMAVLAEKDRDLTTFRALADASDDEQAQSALATVLPSGMSELLEHDELNRLRARARAVPLPSRARLHADDWLAAAGVFLLVFVATFPVAVPFVVMQQVPPAMRVSNTIAVTMLFVAGFMYGKVVRRSPLLVGFGMVAIGIIIVGFTIALGG
jgi:VIT1/CCC1 family predicted Fe2+/Mn2+ transporter